MSSSAINQGVFQAKVSGIQNQADTSSIYNSGQWSFVNSVYAAATNI